MFILYKVREPLAVDCYRSKGVVYAGKITLTPRLDKVKSLVIGKAFS